MKCGQTSLVPCIEKKNSNMNFSTGQYPKEWKIGYIKPLYKGEDPLNLSNYRVYR